ncbi:chaperonin, 10 kDa family protein [Trichomonas vaginalis G3]|uniref:Chaperonin, 10 kDa family protein n=1 Tax=Trichomonas vaginalis (strain ATCC PRA-98 / G3) TaxID=412133 RepID=A2DWT3_TRIV3|nr:chaperone cofactor-dependent protein refolding [Trichomonas vaginalis G3]EAY15115.1 chaperonin, 10 kDa family protein [Trichomonas vaginalis G3]KAI5499193.1 chaperone cofactor-dependent protein refolding [Trichomonas vaginalis G3]|eukprot:XP_001327338.1 chaperonin, 10 kDa family protein [Trichomonas vaginalis G3]
MLASFGLRFATKKLPIKPLGSRLIVEFDQQMKTKQGNLYIPESAQKVPNQATILAVGPGSYVDGHFKPTHMKPGQRVLMPDFGFQNVKVEGKEYTIMNEDDVLAIFE